MRVFRFPFLSVWRRAWLATALACTAGLAQAAMGLGAIAATATDGPVTLYYPTQAAATAVKRGPFTLMVALDAEPVRGNGRLVVISHGSGGAPWVHANLARTLVEAGFVVALPEHRADNYKDDSNPGPDSWAIRPQEVSRAIDTVARDARFAPLLDLDKVGVYGFSAGGHTALSMAGGRWSAAGFKEHCEAHLVEDFQSCVGLITRLNGGLFDGIKKWVALAVIGHRFADKTVLSHTDARVAAVVAAGPSSADFDMDSFAAPRAPLGLVTLQNDRWLVPRFHSDRVLQACKPCEHIADVPLAGHGAMLSPLPPGLTGLVGDMLNDPPGFDRGQMHAVDEKITAFFVRHLSR
jgi:predicted dienelactone hydrolase